MLAVAVILALPLESGAGAVETACNRSKRQAATRALCDCIGSVADQTLRSTDQRRAADFFKDPDKAHKVWVSQSKSDDAFWERYKTFGAQAEAQCSG